MIDVENLVFTKIATALREAYSDIYVVGEYVNAPSKFPAVYIIEMDNSVKRSTQSSGSLENHADVMYEVDVYSSKQKGKKAECKAIAALVDEKFMQMGFTRTFLQPIPNANDATIYRITGRYRAVVGKDNLVYRNGG